MRELDKPQRSAEGHAFKVIPGDRDPGRYPGTYEWGAFAGLAVELGGYGDIELIDPYTGSRFWFQPADYRARAQANPNGFDLLGTLAEAVAEARRQGWLAPPDGPDADEMK